MSDAAPLDLRAARRRTDRIMLQLALMLANGDIRKAAQLLGITRPSLYDLMALHGFGLPRASKLGNKVTLSQREGLGPMIKMTPLPDICHRMHPDIAPEIDRMNAWINDAAALAATIRRKLAAIKAANDKEG